MSIEGAQHESVCAEYTPKPHSTPQPQTSLSKNPIALPRFPVQEPEDVQKNPLLQKLVDIRRLIRIQIADSQKER